MALPEIEYQKMAEEILNDIDYDIFKDFESGERDFGEVIGVVKKHLAAYIKEAEDLNFRMDGLEK